MKRIGLLLALALTACSKPSHVTLHYVLPDSLSPDAIASMTTTVTVTDGSLAFSTTKPRTVADGIVLYETADTNPAVLVTFDTATGYTFEKSFDFTLLAPSGKAPQVSIKTLAYDSSRNEIGHSVTSTATFSSSTTTTITLIDDHCGSMLCGSGTICCGGACIDPTSDDKNCGTCGTTCTGVTDDCNKGVCTCDGASACPAGETCANGCVDTSTDPHNCGSIGHKCGLGETCTGGTCGCGTAPSCAAGSLCCDGACAVGAGCPCGGTTCDATKPICCTSGSVSTCTETEGSDTTNCGACGKTCGTNEVCTGGDCMCGSSVACNAGDSCCGDGCKSLMTDVANCGVCGKACGAGETCDGGTCKCGTAASCGTGEICCATGTPTNGTGTPMTCVDPTKPDNCAACGNACGSNETCTAQGCACSGTSAICTTGQTCCPGSGCTDVTRDPANCGTCGDVCASGKTCTNSLCVGGSNVCNPPCTNGLSCNGGQCECGDSAGHFKLCSGATTMCAAGACVQCLQNSDCAASQLCCGNACVARNNSQCSTCGVPCASGQCCTISSGYVCQGSLLNFSCTN